MVGLGVLSPQVSGGQKAESGGKTGGFMKTCPKWKKRAIILNNDNDDTRRLFESCLSRGKHVCNPIVDWSDQQVWEYIQAEKIPMNSLRNGISLGWLCRLSYGRKTKIPGVPHLPDL